MVPGKCYDPRTSTKNTNRCNLKSFKHKPEQIIGERFDGTPESAKKILDWFRAHPESDYQFHDYRLKEVRYDLGQTEPVDVNAIPCLEIATSHSRFYIHIGTWLMLTEENEFLTFRDEHLFKHYEEI